MTGNSVKFGPDFEFDLRAYELRRSHQALKLERIPMETLRLLLEQRGHLVTREQIVDRIWGKNVYVDTDNSINAAIRKVRQVLDDDSEHPRFIQTITGRGYRFIAAVEPAGETDHYALAEELTPLPDKPAPDGGQTASGGKAGAKQWPILLGITLVLLAALAAYFPGFRTRVQPPAPNRRLMLAVLPFENLTGDAGQDYFSDGLTEEMISQMGRVNAQRLGVIARTSVMHYKHTPEQVGQIGRELGVQYILEGSVRRDAGKVRITAQLIQVQDQTDVWAQSYDRDLKDLLVLQSEIAHQIADEIQTALGDHKANTLPHEPSLSPQTYEAYDLYLKGLFFWNKRTVEGFQRAIDYFQQAIARDPGDARAYAGLANSYTLLSAYSGGPADDFIPKARAAAQRALQLDERLPEAHTALALIVQNYDYDWKTAEQEYRRAIELNPNYATAHHWYAEHLMWRGRFDDALRESERARQLDPLSLIIATDDGAILYYSRQYDRAVAQLSTVIEMDPDFERAQYLMVSAYAQRGMYAEALADTEKTRLAWGDDMYWSALAQVRGRSGQQGQAQLALNKLLGSKQRGPINPVLLVSAYAGMGNKEEALLYLEKAYAQHSNLMTTLKVDPVLDPLRSTPRFQDLLRRVGLAQ